MYARQKLNGEHYGNNFISHDLAPKDVGGRVRDSNTFKSGFALEHREVPDARPVATPVRQSHKHSDIFGTKGDAETVLPNAHQLATAKQRSSNTFKSHAGTETYEVREGERNRVTHLNDRW